MADVTLICGPPGCGKTARALETYRRAVERRGADSVLLLLPNGATVTEARVSLMSGDSVKGLLNPQIMQYYALVEALLRANGEAGADVSDGLKQLLLDEIAEQMCRQGKLRYFAVDAGGGQTPLPGLAHAVAALISELKQAAIQPEEFGRALKKRKGGRKDTELAALYAAYQDRIRSAKLFDAEGKLWRVLVLIREGKLGHLECVTDVIVDGFTNFTPAQFNILRSLAERVDRFTITLTADEPAGQAGPLREGLFRTASETLQLARGGLGPDVREVRMPGRPTGVAALDRLADKLFAGHFAHDFSGDAAEAVSVTVAPGQEPEIEAIAREIKHRIVHDGTRPERIALLTGTDDRNGIIAEVFERMGIPASFQSPRRLDEFPLARELSCLLRVLEGDTSSVAVLNLVKCGRLHLHTGAPHPAPARIEQLCRLANVVGNRDDMLKDLRTLGRTHERRLESGAGTLGDDPKPVSEAVVRDCRATLEYLSALFKLLDSLPREAGFGGFADSLKGLLDDLGFLRDAGGSDRATGALLALLRELPLLDRLAAGAGATHKLGDFIARLRKAIPGCRIHRGGRIVSGVRVMPFTDARGLFFDHVYIPGMLESRIPAGSTRCPFYSDLDRRRINQGGIITLKERRPLQDDEMFGFFLAVTRARRSLHFSYSRLDERGKEPAPSQYLEEVMRLLSRPVAGGEGEPTVQRRFLSAAEVFPPCELAARPAELAGRIAGALWRDADRGDAARLYNRFVPDFPARRALACARRDSSQPYGSWDGLLRDPRILERMAAQLTDRPLSSTRLDAYITCPFAYFARNALHIDRLPEPEVEVGPLRRGTLVHDIAFEFYRRLRATRDRTTFTREELAEMLPAMDAAADERFARGLARGELHAGGPWQVRRRLLIELLRRFVTAQAAPKGSEPDSVPTYFEVAFGFDVRRELQDPASTQKPLEIEVGDITLRIHGTIDRIDLVAGGGGFRVLDYKTGNPPNANAIEGAEKLQLPLYLLAARRLIFGDRPEVEAHSADVIPLKGTTEKMQKRLSMGAKSKPLIRRENREAVFQAVHERLASVVDGIRGGRFCVAPSEKQAPCGYCEYRQICLYTKSRHDRKCGPGSNATRSPQ